MSERPSFRFARSVKRFLAIVGLALAIGPPIGGALVAFAASLGAIASAHANFDELVSGALIALEFPLFSLMAYFPGTAPAILAGLLFAVADGLVPARVSRLGMAAAAGAAAAGVCAALLNGPWASLEFIAIEAALGAISGLICAWLAKRMGWFARGGPMPATTSVPETAS